MNFTHWHNRESYCESETNVEVFGSDTVRDRERK